MQSNNEMEKQEQEKILVYQILQRRLQELLEQNSLLERKMLEIETTKTGLNHLKKSKTKSEIMIPIGSECFINGSTDVLEKVVVNVGSNILIEKTVEEAFQFLQKRVKKIDDAKLELNKEINKIVTRMNEITLQLRG